MRCNLRHRSHITPRTVYFEKTFTTPQTDVTYGFRSHVSQYLLLLLPHCVHDVSCFLSYQIIFISGGEIFPLLGWYILQNLLLLAEVTYDFRSYVSQYLLLLLPHCLHDVSCFFSHQILLILGSRFSRLFYASSPLCFQAATCVCYGLSQISENMVSPASDMYVHIPTIEL
jgi:hypothetical protein